MTRPTFQAGDRRQNLVRTPAGGLPRPFKKVSPTADVRWLSEPPPKPQVKVQPAGSFVIPIEPRRSGPGNRGALITGVMSDADPAVIAKWTKGAA